MIHATNTTTTTGVEIAPGYPNQPFLTTLPGESIFVRSSGSPIASIEAVTVPEGTPPTVEEGVITPGAVGRHHYRVTTSDGATADVSIIACEPACLVRLPDEQRSGGGKVNKRRVLAELARYGTFAGQVDELAHHNLGAFGGA